MIHPREKWLRSVAVSSLVLGFVLVVLTLGLGSATRVASLQFVPTQFEPKSGHAYEVNLRRALEWPWQAIGDGDFGRYRSDLLLLEDDHPLGPPHSEYPVIERDGAGSFSHWGRRLAFSTSDNSDPRTNGRSYSARVTAGIAQDIRQSSGRVGGAIIVLAALLYAAAGRRSLRSALQTALVHVRRRLREYAIALSVPAVVGLAQVWLLPPIWNGSDSTIWLLWQWMWIPHHPPVYPAFMALANGVFDTPSGVVSFAIVVQQVALIVAIGYLASAYREAWQILLVSASACLGSALNLYSHGLFTEGLALPFFLVFLGAVLRLPRDGCTARLAGVCGIGLLGAASTRHALLLFGAIPVIYLFLARFLSRGETMGSALKPFGYGLIAVASAGIGSTVLTQYSCLLLDSDCTSIIGRAGVYRVQEAYKLAGAREAEQWLSGLKQRAADPQVAKAIDYMAKVSNPWTGPRDAIAADRELDAHSPDRLMNAGYRIFALSFDDLALRQWRAQAGKALLGVGGGDYCPGQVTCLLEGSASAIESVYPLDARTLEAADGTTAVDQASSAVYRGLAALDPVRSLDFLLPLVPGNRAFLLGSSALLGIIAMVLRREGQLAALIISLWIGAATYVVMLTYITVVLPRYITPLDIIVWTSNAIALIAIADVARGAFKQQTARFLAP